MKSNSLKVLVCLAAIIAVGISYNVESALAFFLFLILFYSSGTMLFSARTGLIVRATLSILSIFGLMLLQSVQVAVYAVIAAAVIVVLAISAKLYRRQT